MLSRTRGKDPGVSGGPGACSLRRTTGDLDHLGIEIIAKSLLAPLNTGQVSEPGPTNHPARGPQRLEANFWE
eukprot:6556763-Pyramimonas_sp.AAC.1